MEKNKKINTHDDDSHPWFSTIHDEDDDEGCIVSEEEKASSLTTHHMTSSSVAHCGRPGGAAAD